MLDHGVKSRWFFLHFVIVIVVIVMTSSESERCTSVNNVALDLFGDIFGDVLQHHVLKIKSIANAYYTINEGGFGISRMDYFDPAALDPADETFYLFDTKDKITVDTGNHYTCFSDALIKKLAHHNKSWDLILPKYPKTYNWGGAYLMFGVNMWFKIGSFKFIMPVYYGCNVLDNDAILGLDFLQFIESVQIHKPTHEQLIIFETHHTKHNFLHLVHDVVSGQKYYRPQASTLVNIDKYYHNKARRSGSIRSWGIWLKGAHYSQFKRSLTFAQIRAFMSLSANTAFATERVSHKERAEGGQPIDVEMTLDSDDIWSYYYHLEGLKVKKFQKKNSKYRASKMFTEYHTTSLISKKYVEQIDNDMLRYNDTHLRHCHSTDTRYPRFYDREEIEEIEEI